VAQEYLGKILGTSQNTIHKLESSAKVSKSRRINKNSAATVLGYSEIE
jgi:hypothetical protein